jgi:hypothetical protein
MFFPVKVPKKKLISFWWSPKFSSVKAITAHDGSYSANCADHGDFYGSFQADSSDSDPSGKTHRPWVRDQGIWQMTIEKWEK